MESQSPIDSQAIDDDEVKVDDNVDQVFADNIKKLRESGLYDDRMIEKMKAISNLSSSAPTAPLRPVLRGAVLGRPDYRPDLVEFTNDDNYGGEGGQGFKPIENSGLKWSLPITRYKRPRSPSPHSSTHTSDSKDRVFDSHRDPNRERDVTSNGYRDDNRVKVESESYGNDRRNDYNNSAVGFGSEERRDLRGSEEKSLKFKNFFESRKQTKVEKKTEVITDIDAFIKGCTKEAEKPKPLSIDDLDDYITQANNRLNNIFKK